MIQEQIVLKHTYTVNSGSAAVVTFPLADICYIGGRAILQLAQLIMLLCKRMITNMAKIRCLQTRVHLNLITFPWRYPPPFFFSLPLENMGQFAQFHVTEPFGHVWITEFPIRHRTIDAHLSWKVLLLIQWMAIYIQWFIKCKSVWILNYYYSILCFKIIWKFICLFKQQQQTEKL